MNTVLMRATGVAAPHLPEPDLAPDLPEPEPDPAPALAPDLATAPLDVLLRAVIARASALTPDTELLLDVTVDGVRCAVTAVQPSRAKLLSPREREIARMGRIFAKLGVSTRAAMVVGG